MTEGCYGYLITDTLIYQYNHSVYTLYADDAIQVLLIHTQRKR